MRWFFCLVLQFLSFFALDARIVLLPLHNKDTWNSRAGYPGIKLRLTRKGAEHVKDVGVKLLNEQLANLSGFRVQHAFEQPGLTGHIYVNGIKTLRYQPPSASRIEFSSPSFITFAIEGAAISYANLTFISNDVSVLMGAFSEYLDHSKYREVNGQLVGMNVSLTTSFRITADGTMSVNVVNCTTFIQQSNFVLSPEGPLSTIVKTFEVQINDLIRQRIPNLFCRGLTDIIEKNSPRLFQKLNRAQLTEHFRQNLNGSGVIERFIRRLTDGLYIDGHQIANPIVTEAYFETQQSGELRYNQTLQRAPFFPRPIPQDNDADRMLYLYGSEYALNSLLYHAYQTDRLSLKIEKDALSPMYKGFVRTTCEESMANSEEFLSSICVGKLIPQISEKFPNTTSKFVLLPHELPQTRFVEGFSSMDVRTRILTYVDDHGRDRQILVSSADGLVDIKLNADDGKFSGDLKLRKLDVRLHRSGIGGIDPESIKQLAPLAKTFLGPQLSQGLKQGFPFPLKDSITFLQPKLTIHDGFVRLATDFYLGEKNLREKIQEAFERIKNS